MIIMHDKENIEDHDNIEKTSSKESVNSQEFEETQRISGPALPLRHFARATAGELSSTITNVFGRLTI